MKKITLLAAGVLAATTSFSQVAPSFKHVKRIDLTTVFGTGLPSGETPTDVCSDGSSIYIAGMKNTAGTGAVGVVKVIDPIGVGGFSNVYSVTGGGDGTDAKIDWIASDSRIAFGYGFGTVDGLGGTTGVVTLDPNGTPYNTFSTDGLLTPDEAQSILGGTTSSRFDALAYDRSGANRIDVGFRSRGSLARINPLTGSATGGVTIVSGGNFTAVRHIAFDISTGNGFNNIFYRLGNDVLFSTRTGNSNLSTPIVAFDLAAESGGGAAQQTLAFRPGDANFLPTMTYNDRSSQTAAFDAVRVATWNGSVATPAGTVSGAEPIGGVAQQEFTSTILGTRFATIGGKDYLLVVGIAGPSSRRVLSIYELVSAVPVSGTLDLGAGFSGSYSAPGTFVVELVQGGTVIDTTAAAVAVDGTYSFATSLQGTYDLRFKGPHWLGRIKTGVVIGSGGATGVNASVINGDVDGDDVVSVFDYIGLSDAFDADPSAGNWLAAADLDHDGVVSVFDYIILSDNFDLQGDQF